MRERYWDPCKGFKTELTKKKNWSLIDEGQAISQGVEGPEWEAIYYRYKHTVWTTVLNLFFQECIGTAIESYFDEAELERIALSCRFTLDLLCDKGEFHYRPMLRLAIKAVNTTPQMT